MGAVGGGIDCSLRGGGRRGGDEGIGGRWYCAMVVCFGPVGCQIRSQRREIWKRVFEGYVVLP